VIAILAVIGIAIVAARTRPEQRWRRIALAAIAGGALGNVIDRIREGAVTDFIRWHIHDHLWPIFNVADAALLVGVVLLVLQRRPAPAPA
jgi:signal peptidase II